MRRINLAAALVAVSLTLGGCMTLSEIGTAFHYATASVNNPVSATNIYQIKNGYAAAAQLAVEYRNYCWSASYRVLMADPVGKALCKSRRPVTRAIMAADSKAFFAVSAAENFVRDNPTLSAATVISAAAKAVADFRNAIPAK
jgi:predicted small secreted protein